MNTTDITDVLDWSEAQRGVFYRSEQQQTTLFLDAAIILRFKAHA